MSNGEEWEIKMGVDREFSILVFFGVSVPNVFRQLECQSLSICSKQCGQECARVQMWPSHKRVDCAQKRNKWLSWRSFSYTSNDPDTPAWHVIMFWRPDATIRKSGLHVVRGSRFDQCVHLFWAQLQRSALPNHWQCMINSIYDSHTFFDWLKPNPRPPPRPTWGGHAQRNLNSQMGHISTISEIIRRKKTLVFIMTSKYSYWSPCLGGSVYFQGHTSLGSSWGTVVLSLNLSARMTDSKVHLNTAPVSSQNLVHVNPTDILLALQKKRNQHGRIRVP